MADQLTVQGPDGKNYQFPSDATDDEIKTFFSGQAAPAAAEPAHAGAVGRFLSGVWEQVNPVAMAEGMAQAARHPIDTATNVLHAQGALYDKAKEAFTQGRYAEGARHAIDYLLPLIGPPLDALGDKAQAGDVAGAVGGTFGLGGAMVAPEAFGRALAGGVGMRVPSALSPVERDAVAFAQQRGIPVDAATATGNKAVRGAQFLADRSLGGSLVAGQAAKAQESALTRVSGELAAQAHPTAVSPYQAGDAIQTAVQQRVADYGAQATHAYEQLRQIEASPALTRQVSIRVPMTASDGTVQMSRQTVPMQMPVDLRAVKAQLQPVYDRMLRQMPVAQQRADPALHAIKNVLDSPDYMPASVIDMDLSAMKALARTDNPTRTVSQVLAATAVRTLDAQVQRAVAQGGPDAIQALQAGRAATTAKYTAADLLKSLRDEPRQVFDQATWANDAGIDRLTAIAKQAPNELPKVGRAYLDNLFSQATAEGRFGKTASLATQWQKLGPQTKQLLFKDPAYIKDLDHFFLFAKRAADNPNPSGTAYVGAIGAQGAYLYTEPVSGALVQLSGAALSKLLHSPAGVRLLMRGLRTPVIATGAAKATAAAIQKAAQAAPLLRATPSALPLSADAQEATP